MIGDSLDAARAAAGPSASELANAPLAGLAMRVATTWMEAHPAESMRWNWGEGVLAYGLVRLARAFGAPAGDPLRAYVARYLRAHQARGVRILWSDHTTPGLSAAELALAGDASVRPVLDRVVQYVMEAPRTEAQGLVRHLGRRVPAWLWPARLPDAWVDSLFHFAITLCRYSRLSGDAQYRKEAAAQVARFAQNLQDPASGLFTHAYNDRPRDRRVPPFASRAFWARGNGWALVSLIEVLQELAPGDSAQRELVERARALSGALAAAQRAHDGLFHTLLLAPDSYVETAGSALIAYGFARGARAGLLGDDAASRAARALSGLRNQLEVRGGGLEVCGTSLGTNPNLHQYARIRRRNQVSYGVGAWLLAASAQLEPHENPI